MIKVADKKPLEGEIRFDFSAAENVWNFDESGNHHMSHCMKAVDFIVEWETEVWLVEIKDPLKSTIPSKYKCQRERSFLEELDSGTLFDCKIGPKLKDSFLYMYLEKFLWTKPFKCLVVLCVDFVETAIFLKYTDKLESSICFKKRDGSAWNSKYIESVALFNLDLWNKSFTKCPATRESS